MTIIEDGAFSNCKLLKSITIPNASINKYAFIGCTSLESINVDINNKYYVSENGILYNKEKTEIIKYPEGKKDLDLYYFPEETTVIEEGAFSDSISLNRLIILDNIKQIRSNAISENIIIYTKSGTEAHRYAEEEQGYIIDEQGPIATYTPNGNQIVQKEYKIKISAKDNIGNERITRSEEFDFDNTAPIANIEYSTKELSRENVKVTITVSEKVKEIDGWTLSDNKKELTKEYIENTKETIVIKDLAVNEAEAIIEISNIDNTLLEITIGDINNDGNIDVTDLFLLKIHIIAESREGWKLTGDSLLVADMNEDGNVDVTDLLILKR